ncbi:hypothetical protein BD777DRAFT_129443 [Yarrowia lipolytica]|nr:hypothetical protein BD777DRAFT_129443 [Yarrowia lipolytica]
MQTGGLSAMNQYNSHNNASARKKKRHPIETQMEQRQTSNRHCFHIGSEMPFQTSMRPRRFLRVESQVIDMSQ